MCGDKGYGFDPFWSEIEYRFNHLGLKSGKVSGTRTWNWVLLFSRHKLLFRCHSGLKLGRGNLLFWSKIG